MKRNVPLKRTSRLSPVSKRKRERSGVAGKLGRVRLYGSDLKALRDAVYARDGGRCQWTTNGVSCGRWMPKDGDLWTRAHLAHKVSRGAGGSDTLENCEIRCPHHHLVSEHTKGEKPS